ncbi:uncharacterized protein K444DRAFT_242912 [Hyaloscypha bicolor E]|uniref:Uncharacterized protein n=1 Tax=Hyaloscypha bicolor E TaxID=1095630 RepID=A0A2J6SM28_9HELO|nr:uncharacterized protein K444DRAFT_242912 [Hyaloscypha bicolor E]PMD51821.1 hypothetical protein K444DRAFT_242912 [Hyaloscypha bicolor E]
MLDRQIVVGIGQSEPLTPTDPGRSLHEGSKFVGIFFICVGERPRAAASHPRRKEGRGVSFNDMQVEHGWTRSHDGSPPGRTVCFSCSEDVAQSKQCFFSRSQFSTAVVRLMTGCPVPTSHHWVGPLSRGSICSNVLVAVSPMCNSHVKMASTLAIRCFCRRISSWGEGASLSSSLGSLQPARGFIPSCFVWQDFAACEATPSKPETGIFKLSSLRVYDYSKRNRSVPRYSHLTKLCCRFKPSTNFIFREEAFSE